MPNATGVMSRGGKVKRTVGVIAAGLLVALGLIGYYGGRNMAAPPSDFVAKSGANLPYINYGWDLGRNPWDGKHGGFASNRKKLESDFAFLAKHKVSVVRIFTFCDLRSGVLFDNKGNPTGFDPYALKDFEVLVETAQAHHLLLIPSLFDFMLADGVSQEGDCPVGEHPDLISDPGKSRALLGLFRTLIKRFGNHKAIMAWEVINEPNYATAVSLRDLKIFVKQFVEMIHAEAPGAKVTVGCETRGDLKDWTDVGLDLYQFHYYDYMESEYPFDFPISRLGLDRPVFIGEAQPSKIIHKLKTAKKNGVMGLLFWTGDREYDFTPVASQYKRWAEAN